MSNMKELIGKTVMRLRVSQGENYLVFDLLDGTSITYETYGDCCSETWFADITGIQALLGAVVLEAASVDIEDAPENDERSRQEYDSFYGVKLKTTKGYVDIVYRNSSNGYYGGNIELCTGVALENSLKATFTEITDDWSA